MATNQLTLDGLKTAMKEDLLKPFNNEGVEISDSTIHEEVLSDSDGAAPSVSSKKLYIGALKWTIWANGGKQVKFPSNWMEKTVAELAEFIISKQDS